jgi:uncharacterized protein (DUF2336 family)
MEYGTKKSSRPELSHAKSVIAELERTVAAGSSERRAEIMRSVTDLFLSAPTQLTEEQVSLFDDVINRLIGRLESQALAELSARFASSSNAPPQVIHRLASHDSIDIAGPILADSNCLTDASLVAIAESKSQHHLSKIAERQQLSSKVTDVLVDRGNRDVVMKVAANSGARFSNIGMSTLAMKADGDDDLIEMISRRTDIPSLIFSQLLSYASDQARERLLATRPADQSTVDHVLRQVAANATRLAATAKDWAAAQRFVQSFGQDTESTRVRVLAFADNGQVTELVAALSVLSGIQTDLIGRLICDQNGFGTMVLCKSLNFDWSIAHAVLSAGPCAKAHAVQLEQLCRDFEQLSLVTGRRLLSYWQGRMKTRAVFESA